MKLTALQATLCDLLVRPTCKSHCAGAQLRQAIDRRPCAPSFVGAAFCSGLQQDARLPTLSCLVLQAVVDKLLRQQGAVQPAANRFAAGQEVVLQPALLLTVCHGCVMVQCLFIQLHACSAAVMQTVIKPGPKTAIGICKNSWQSYFLPGLVYIEARGK